MTIINLYSIIQPLIIYLTKLCKKAKPLKAGETLDSDQPKAIEQFTAEAERRDDIFVIMKGLVKEIEEDRVVAIECASGIKDPELLQKTADRRAIEMVFLLGLLGSTNDKFHIEIINHKMNEDVACSQAARVIKRDVEPLGKKFDPEEVPTLGKKFDPTEILPF